MSDKNPGKRLPRQRRVDEAARPPMKLTDRDCEIIRFVNDCRALRGDQIERLFFSSISTRQTRLALLFHHEYLDRQFLSIAASVPASNPAVYTVGERGMEILVNRFGYELSDLRRPKKGVLSWRFLEHLLTVNDVRIAIMQAAEYAQFTIDEWIDETAFRSKREDVYVPDSRGLLRKYPVYPDGYFSLTTPQHKARFFLEVDRGTESLSKFAPQIRLYDAYIASGQYQARFRAKSLRVLIVASSVKRLKSLKSIAEHVGGDRKFCFAALDDVNPATILTGKIWQRIGTPEKIALFE